MPARPSITKPTTTTIPEKTGCFRAIATRSLTAIGYKRRPPETSRVQTEPYWKRSKSAGNKRQGGACRLSRAVFDLLRWGGVATGPALRDRQRRKRKAVTFARLPGR